jgi:hypothetical protein
MHTESERRSGEYDDGREERTWPTRPRRDDLGVTLMHPFWKYDPMYVHVNMAPRPCSLQVPHNPDGLTFSRSAARGLHVLTKLTPEAAKHEARKRRASERPRVGWCEEFGGGSWLLKVYRLLPSRPSTCLAADWRDARESERELRNWRVEMKCPRLFQVLIEATADHER